MPPSRSSLVLPAPRTWLSCLLLVVVCGFIFQPVPGFDFVMFDDDVNFAFNPGYGPLEARDLGWLTGEHAADWAPAPLGWLAAGLLSSIEGVSAHWLHLYALCLHAAAACLLYVLLESLGRGAQPRSWLERSAALLLAAGWAWHPLRVEAVAWCSALFALQAAFLGLAGLVCLQQSRLGQTSAGPLRSWRLAALALHCAALLSDVSAIAFLPLQAGLLLLPAAPGARTGAPRGEGSRVAGKRLAGLLPFAVVTLAWLVLLGLLGGADAQAPEGGAAQGGSFAPLERLAQGCAVLMHFLNKTLVPAGLHPAYPLLEDLAPAAPFFVLSMAGCLGLVLLVLALAWRRPASGLMLFAALLSCLPFLGLGNPDHAPSDHHTLVPALGLALAASTLARGASTFWIRLGLRPLLMLSLAVLPLWCVLARAQTGLWSSDERLFRRMAAAQQSPERREALLAKLSAAQCGRGDTAAAASLLAELRASGLAPERAERWEHSLQLTEQLAPLAPYSVVLENQGSRAWALGRPLLAEDKFRRALALSPDNNAARYSLCLLLADSGRTGEALLHFNRLGVSRKPLEPGLAQALRTELAAALRRQGDEEAALRLQPQAPRPAP